MVNASAAHRQHGACAGAVSCQQQQQQQQQVVMCKSSKLLNALRNGDACVAALQKRIIPRHEQEEKQNVARGIYRAAFATQRGEID